MTHSTDPAPGRWAACVQEILRSWYDMTGAAAPYLTAYGVADTLLESLVCEVEAATAADLREELRRAQRAIDNLREQHCQRTAREQQAQTLWEEYHLTPGDHEVGIWCTPCGAAILGPDGWNVSYGWMLGAVDVRELETVAQAHRDTFHPTPKVTP